MYINKILNTETVASSFDLSYMLDLSLGPDMHCRCQWFKPYHIENLPDVTDRDRLQPNTCTRLLNHGNLYVDLHKHYSNFIINSYINVCWVRIPIITKIDVTCKQIKCLIIKSNNPTIFFTRTNNLTVTVYNWSKSTQVQ